MYHGVGMCTSVAVISSQMGLAILSGTYFQSGLSTMCHLSRKLSFVRLQLAKSSQLVLQWPWLPPSFRGCHCAPLLAPPHTIKSATCQIWVTVCNIGLRKSNWYYLVSNWTSCLRDRICKWCNHHYYEYHVLWCIWWFNWIHVRTIVTVLIYFLH